MRNWVRWCLDHRMKFVLYMAVVLVLPVYFLRYVSDGWDDFKHELKQLKGLK
jgi:hypothetical protein